MDKGDNMQEQMSDISREMEILRESKKEMPEIKNTVTYVKTAFDGLICRLETAEERISKFEEISTETSKIEKQKQRVKKTEQSIQGLWEL